MTTPIPGEWVRFHHHEGFSVTGKVLERRPDDKLVVGQHENDPEPAIVHPDNIMEVL